MTQPRILVRGATFALTRRTTCRKAFLAPWHEQVEACWLYALADAQRRHGVAVHHAVRVVTHHHLSVTAQEANLPDFLRDFHRDVSRSLAALLARERYEVQREIFDGRPTHVLRLLDPLAQAHHLLYEHLNPVAAGLVERPTHMPGRVLRFGHWKSGGLRVKRPPFYFAKDRPEELWLELTPPPLLYEAFGGDLDALVYQLERLSEQGRRALGKARTRPALGAQRLGRVHPWQEPRSPAEPGGQPVPSFRVGGRDRQSQVRRIRAALETRGFRRSYHQARKEYLAGDREVAFPHGTYGARVLYGARVAEPEPEADLCRPGPVLQEVREALQAEPPGSRSRAARAEERRALVEALEERWSSEGVEERLDLSQRPLAEEGGREVEARSEEVQVRRLGGRRPDPRAGRPRRLVTLRDRRRGRPPGRRSGDPPA